jgi:NAD(P)-dependent dehydrogenase (short-subunit alcohol dehydrogenase family)
LTHVNRVAVVTGGASGIGREVARALAAQGAALAVADINLEGAGEVAAALMQDGAKAEAIAVDVSRAEQADAMIARAIEAFGKVDILVHSAGVGVERSFLETTPEEWQRILDIDLSGTFFCGQAAARHMVERGYGRIVNLASTAGVRGGTGRAAYGTAKGGVIALTKVMAVELAPFGVTVNALAPGYVLTDLNEEFFASPPGQALMRRVPMGRLGQPADLAAPLLFLLSDASAYITGQLLAVDGGHSVSNA